MLNLKLIRSLCFLLLVLSACSGTKQTYLNGLNKKEIYNDNLTVKADESAYAREAKTDYKLISAHLSDNVPSYLPSEVEGDFAFVVRPDSRAATERKFSGNEHTMKRVAHDLKQTEAEQRIHPKQKHSSYEKNEKSGDREKNKFAFMGFFAPFVGMLTAIAAANLLGAGFIWIGPIISIIGLVFSIRGIKSKRKGLAIAGLILGAFILSLWAVLIAFTL